MIFAVMVLILLAILGWLCSIRLKDVSVVDILWSLFFLSYNFVLLFKNQSNITAKNIIVFLLVVIWSLRLSGYLLLRKWKKPGEDWRYQRMRAANPQNFWYRSLWTIFLLQCVLAVVINFPLHWIFMNRSNFHWFFDSIALILWCVGMYWESLSDYQMWKFKSNTKNHNMVLRQGLWGYSRHPNYFGEFLIWWSYFLFAFSIDFGIITIISPLLMSYLLLKVSGVGMLEKGLSKTKPEYVQYCKDVPVFFPEKLIRDYIDFFKAKVCSRN